jgi:hypothetical protein
MESIAKLCAELWEKKEVGPSSLVFPNHFALVSILGGECVKEIEGRRKGRGNGGERRLKERGKTRATVVR